MRLLKRFYSFLYGLSISLSMIIDLVYGNVGLFLVLVMV